ncbi:50S ribosomal protein L1 [Candidatus Uabimicrobium sp. HlEnr_7]|uniref:50S ribosomal protein L1 n=1 Tax=Candidatus Uabimicrobium helgolandensis TaxID=3095367 RepID=UPI0035591156
MAKKKAEQKAETQAEAPKEEKKRRRPGPARRRSSSKRHAENLTKVDEKKRYSVDEAIKILQSCKRTKFDETVEVSMKLGIDPRKSDQLVRGSVSLPKGTGKTIKILVFAEGDPAAQAKEAGADYVGSSEYADKIQKEGWLDFDLVIAHPAMMRHVGKLGKILGPKGKMPSPKSGTVTPNVAQAVKEFKAGKVEFRSDGGGNVLAPLGRMSFAPEDLIVNATAFIEHISNIKPSTAKGTYMQKVCISSSMGPGLMIETGK